LSILFAVHTEMLSSVSIAELDIVIGLLLIFHAAL